jgi:hypothetical protein
MNKVGILAYGSLIDDPGNELSPLIIGRIHTKTPFPVEYARISRSRDNAPTLIPYKDGISVDAEILILNSDISIQAASDILYRRETRKVNNSYNRPNTINENSVLIEALSEFEKVGTVLYTKIGSNIVDLTPRNLALYAIESAKKNAGLNKKDGISYLKAAINNGIITKLTAEYESNILSIMKAETLDEAYNICQSLY